MPYFGFCHTADHAKALEQASVNSIFKAMQDPRDALFEADLLKLIKPDGADENTADNDGGGGPPPLDPGASGGDNSNKPPAQAMGGGECGGRRPPSLSSPLPIPSPPPCPPLRLPPPPLSAAACPLRQYFPHKRLLSLPQATATRANEHSSYGRCDPSTFRTFLWIQTLHSATRCFRKGRHACACMAPTREPQANGSAPYAHGCQP